MQLHKRLTSDQIKLALDWYSQGLMSRDEALAKLGLKRRRFYALLKDYRAGKLATAARKRTNAHRKIDTSLESVIRRELTTEKQLLASPDIPLSTYNYVAITDRVIEQTGVRVSAQTVRNRAKAWGYYLPKHVPKAKHVRVVLTTATGLLLQHDASHHLWSPFADKKWVLITTRVYPYAMYQIP